MKWNLTGGAWRGGMAALALLLACAAVPAQAATLKFEALLIWGTNDPQSPDPKHKPVGPEIRRKLDDLPLKWANYFQICKKHLETPEGAPGSVTMSDKCKIEVRNLGESKVEVSLFGKGAAVWKRAQKMGVGEVLVLGGNAPNATAWLVTLKRVE